MVSSSGTKSMQGVNIVKEMCLGSSPVKAVGRGGGPSGIWISVWLGANQFMIVPVLTRPSSVISCSSWFGVFGDGSWAWGRKLDKSVLSSWFQAGSVSCISPECTPSPCPSSAQTDCCPCRPGRSLHVLLDDLSQKKLALRDTWALSFLWKDAPQHVQIMDGGNSVKLWRPDFFNQTA